MSHPTPLATAIFCLADFNPLPFIYQGLVERVAVIFFNSDDIPLEKFIFKLAMNLSYGSSVEEVDLQFSLRSFMSKLSISESLTKKLPPGKYRVYTPFVKIN